MPNSTFERICIDTLEVHPRNEEHRHINAEQFEALKTSIRDGSLHHADSIDGETHYRLLETVLVNRNGNRILSGHKRVEALAALGQDFIDERDIQWCEYTPDSSEELARVVIMNSPQSSGEFTAGTLVIIDELAAQLPDFARDTRLTNLRDDLASLFTETTLNIHDGEGSDEFATESDRSRRFFVEMEITEAQSNDDLFKQALAEFGNLHETTYRIKGRA